MRAITLWQPWAGAVAVRLKRHETRSWKTDYRGPILIHAAVKVAGPQAKFRWEAYEQLLEWRRTADWVDEEWAQLTMDRIEEYLVASKVLGAVVARANLTECWPTDGTPPASRGDRGWLNALTPPERLFGDYSPGRYAWQLEDLVPLAEPIPCKGMQGLWTPEPAVAARAMA